MSATFNEGLVERSYHTLWEKHFAGMYGSQEYETFVPGKEEVHVGFDLGFAGPDPSFKFTKGEFFNWIKSRIKDTKASSSAFVFAYFYQYKLISPVILSRLRDPIVKAGLITSGYPPTGVAYRAKLDTTRKKFANNTKQHDYSQHEALCRLSRVRDAEVFYCTPKFDESMGIPSEPTRSLNDLTRTPVTLNTPDFANSAPHHLYFEDVLGANPMWCSDPIPAENGGEIRAPALLTPEQFLKFMKANYLLDDSDRKIDYNEIKISDDDLNRKLFFDYINALPACGRISVIF